MRCPRCGNENPEDNRFCGMCGTTLLAPEPSANKPQAVEVGSTPSTRPDRVPTPRKAPVPVSDDPPSISGPSFLGLNDTSPSRVTPSRRASISIDPDSAPPASNLHYLLEDEEDHKGSGLWKFFLILIALGLAVGFGYLRWKNQGFAWLNPQSKKPAITEAQPTTGEPQPSSSAATSVPPPAPPTSTTPSITPEAQPATPPAGTTPAAANSATPNSAGPPSSSPAGNPPTANASGSADAPRPLDGAITSASPDKPATAPAASPNSDKKAADSAEANDDSDATDDAPAPAKPKAEPPPKPKPTIPVDPVSEARKYLYGKGAPQDCDRGVRLLKPAANAGNPKAMVEMGALYSAGLCAPRDLPTAYRWFAMALRKQPDNQSVQADLSKLWSEMTQPERQLAIKLTQ